MTYELHLSKRTLRVESAKSVLNDLGPFIVESRRTKIYLQSISSAARYVLKYTLSTCSGCHVVNLNSLRGATILQNP